MATLNVYTGSTLRIGSFLEMMQELVRLITELTPAALKLDNEAPAFVAKVNQLEALVKRIRAFEETATVASADQSRDAIWLALFYLHHYLKALPETHPLYQYVIRLTPVFNTYKSLYRSELMAETAETRGFLTEMAKTANAEAAAQLGMDALLPHMDNANNTITEANAGRTISAANRQAELGDETSGEVRKQLVIQYRAIVDRVNAANIFFGSEAITTFIQRANAIAEHYRVIASVSLNNNSSGTSGNGSGTTPDSGEGGGTTPDPDQGGGETPVNPDPVNPDPDQGGGGGDTPGGDPVGPDTD